MADNNVSSGFDSGKLVLSGADFKGSEMGLSFKFGINKSIS